MPRTEAYQRAHRRRERQRYYSRLADGLCGRCGKRKVPAGEMVCLECRAKDQARDQRMGRAKDNQRRRVRRANRVAQGYCGECGERREPGHKLCDRCRERHRSYYLREILPLRQQFKSALAKLCSGCRKPPENGYRMCLSCRQRATRYYHQRGKFLRRQKRGAPTEAL